MCLWLAGPLAAAQLAQAGTSFTDTLMMGWLGSQSLAAGALGSTTFLILAMICTGVVSAVSPLVAEAHGSGRLERAGQIAVQGLWLAGLITLPLIVLLWQTYPLFLWLGQEETNARWAAAYIQAIAWGLFPALGFAVLKDFIAALSQPQPVTIAMVGGLLLNAAGNYVLMFGKFGLPTLGLVGTGWASAITYWLMFLFLVGYLFLQKKGDVGILFRQAPHFEGATFWKIVRTGWPIGMIFAAEGGLFAVTTFLMGQLGTNTLAAHQIALQTASITFMVTVGIAYATTIRVGQLFGQGKLQRAKLAGYVGIGLGSLFMLGMGLLFWTLPTTIVALYLDVQNPDNRAVVTTAKSLLGVAAVFQLVDGVQATAAAALRGLQDTRVPMVIGICAYWGFGLTSGYWLGMRLGFGGVGLWWGLAIGLVAAAAILTLRFERLISRLSQQTRQSQTQPAVTGL